MSSRSFISSYGSTSCDQLHPDVLERWPTLTEVVLQHPLGERFADHRPAVGDAEPFGDVGPVLVGGRRGDPVDHAVREQHVVLHPVAEAFIAPGVPAEPGEGGEDLLGDVAVALDVVAGHDRERRQAPVPTPHQGLGDQPEGGARHGARDEIGCDGGVVGVELTGDLVEVVPAFGDGQARRCGWPGRPSSR